MPSFAASLYGSALYTPDPSGVRCSRPASTSPGVRCSPRRTSRCRSGRRTLPVGTSLIAQLHQQRAQNLPHCPLVLGRKFLPPASDLPLPERPTNPEEPLLNHSHRCLLHFHPKVPSHPLHRQLLGLGAPPAPRANQVLELDHR